MNLKASLPHRGRGLVGPLEQRAVSGDIFGRHRWGGGMLPASGVWMRPGMPLKRVAMPRTAPAAKNDPAHNARSAEVDKLWFRETLF